MIARAHEPSFIELFTPKLVTVLRERYRLGDLKADMVAGLTVAIVALPLSMAIAIASGVTPDRGPLHGDRRRLRRPPRSAAAGFRSAAPPARSSCWSRRTASSNGLDGLILATLLSGLILLAVGFLRLGSFIKYIPYPVTVGFTSGIAVVIFASQLKELLGLTLAGQEPGAFLPKLEALFAALPSVNPSALSVTALTIGVILAIRRVRPQWPAFVIAIGLAAVLAWLLGLPVATIGTRFGGIPQSLPVPHLPSLSFDKVGAVLPAALSFALQGSIESLLSAVVADSMTGRRHRSNAELCRAGRGEHRLLAVRRHLRYRNDRPNRDECAGRCARSDRRHAAQPVPAALHSWWPRRWRATSRSRRSRRCWAWCAGTWPRNMNSRRSSARRAATPWCCSATFLLVVFRDLTRAFSSASPSARSCSCIAWPRPSRSSNPVSWSRRMSPTAWPARTGRLTTPRSRPIGTSWCTGSTGAFFFGAAAAVGAALDRIGEHPKAYVIDFSAVPILDSTAAATLNGFAHKARRQGAALYVAGARPQIRRILLTHGVRPPHVRVQGEARRRRRGRAEGSGRRDGHRARHVAPIPLPTGALTIMPSGQLHGPMPWVYESEVGASQAPGIPRRFPSKSCSWPALAWVGAKTEPSPCPQSMSTLGRVGVLWRGDADARRRRHP